MAFKRFNEKKALDARFEEQLVRRLHQWSSELRFNVKLVDDPSVIRSETLRRRACEGKLKAFFHEDNDTLYVFPENVFPEEFDHYDNGWVDNAVITSVLQGGELKHLFSDSLEYQNLMCAVWNLPEVDDYFREQMSVRAGGSDARLSSVAAGEAMLEMMNGVDAGMNMPLARSFHRKLFESATFKRLGVKPSCVKAEYLWNAVRFCLMRKQRQNLSMKSDVQLEQEMVTRLRSCCQSGLARGRDVEFGFSSKALLLAGLPDMRVRMAALAMLAKMAQHGFDVSEIESMSFMSALRDPLCVMPAWGGQNDDCPGRRIVVTDRVIEDHENHCPGLLCFILPSDAEIDWNRSHGRNWIDVTSFHPRSFNYVMSRMMDLYQGGTRNLERELSYVSSEFSSRVERCFDTYKKAIRAPFSVQFLLSDAHLKHITKVVQEIEKTKFSGIKFDKKFADKNQPVLDASGLRDVHELVRQYALSSAAVSNENDSREVYVPPVKPSVDHRFCSGDFSVVTVARVLSGADIKTCRDILRCGTAAVKKVLEKNYPAGEKRRAAFKAVEEYARKCGFPIELSKGLRK